MEQQGMQADATNSAVIARLDRAIQYAQAGVYWITRFRGR
ncbi:MAG: hypothetical protein JWP84_808 [Tardiphaga sp.]|jgi:hypothetical protein|nr:hypothetical protein [Tardiphaga sp.]